MGISYVLGRRNDEIIISRCGFPSFNIFIIMIKCNKCNVLKEATEYRKPSINKSGKTGICKTCKNKQDRTFGKEYYKNPINKANHRKRWEEYISDPKQKELHHQRWQEYYSIEENRQKKLEYTREYYTTNPKAKVIQLTRTRIWHALKSQHNNKTKSTLEALGCSVEEYVDYLEQQFDKHMNWGNHGTYWEIDHIKPLNQGGSFHYTNTRPLIKETNRRRKKKI
jgi:hypothetical protein